MKGKHVSRSVYQKVVEENRRMKKDLKTICFYGAGNFTDAMDKITEWYEYFKDEDEKQKSMRRAAMEWLENHPEDKKFIDGLKKHLK